MCDTFHYYRTCMQVLTEISGTNIIGDEYHVFFECSNANISLQRNRFIPTYFRQNRSMFNFVKLLQSVDDIKIGRRVSSFVINSNIV